MTLADCIVLLEKGEPIKLTNKTCGELGHELGLPMSSDGRWVQLAADEIMLSMAMGGDLTSVVRLCDRIYPECMIYLGRLSDWAARIRPLPYVRETTLINSHGSTAAGALLLDLLKIYIRHGAHP